MAEPTFEWDEAKDRSNQIKHGIAFEQALQAFSDPSRVILEDLDHGSEEPRFFCLGIVGADVLTVRFTWRGERIRIFGAGYWRKGRRIYEKEAR
jgi:uncharacterized DUF497 family protein